MVRYNVYITSLLIAFLITACMPHPVYEANEIVPLGSTRETAIRTLINAGSWYHQPCPNKYSIDDLFFYGEQKLNRAQLVIVTSLDGVVQQVGTLEDADAWLAAYNDCINREYFDS